MSKDQNYVSRKSIMDLAPSDTIKGVFSVTALYVGASTHIAPYLSRQNGLSQKLFLPIWYRVFSFLRLGEPAKGKLPIALLVAGAAVTFMFSASGSVNANASAKGYSNKEPRIRKRELTGLQGRIASTHDNLLEFFSGFAAAAILAAQYDTKGALDNQLALIATLKFIVFPIAYYADLDILRSAAHIIAVGGVVNTFAQIGFA